MEPPGDNHYVFAAFLEPGYHQFIIYDPLIEKAYCQETIIEFNNYQLIYPEMPKLIEQLQMLQVLPPVFKKWIRDDIERENKAYYHDTSPFRDERRGMLLRDNFEPERFIKDSADIASCEELLKQNFKYMQVFYLQCLSRSSKYPEIDLQTIQTQLKVLFFVFNSKVDMAQKLHVKPAEIEVQFISATRHDQKTDRSLCRGEFLELIVRMAHVKYR